MFSLKTFGSEDFKENQFFQFSHFYFTSRLLQILEEILYKTRCFVYFLRGVEENKNRNKKQEY